MKRTSPPSGRKIRQRVLLAIAATLAAIAFAPSASAADKACIDGQAVDGTARYQYCLPYGYGPSPTTSYVDAFYSDVASEVGGRSTYVICWNRADWNWLDQDDRAYGGEGLTGTLGYVYTPYAVINLAPNVCRRLDRLTYLGRRPVGRRLVAMAEAVDTLAHESMHAGFVIEDEPTAECYAIQYTAYTARLLGTNRRYGRRLMRAAWALYGTLDAGYRSAECRNGGSLDLNPASPVWP